MNDGEISAILTTTEEGTIAEWIMQYLAFDCADIHTNFVKLHSPLNCGSEASFEVDVCDPDTTYRIRVEKVY